MNSVPELRIRTLNEAPVRADGEYVVYWMIANRRLTSNFALQRAVEWARDLKRPLLVFEPLRVGYPWACDRLHRFVIEGMAANEARLAEHPHRSVHYLPYVEPKAGAGSGLLAAIAAQACVVVTDDFPCFFLPRMVAAAAARMPVRMETVDSNGILPLRAADREFTVAHSFRRWLQKNLRPHLEEDQFPLADPLAGLRLPAFAGLPASITKKWPAADLPGLLADGGLGKLPIDHTIVPSRLNGGVQAAHERLQQFAKRKLPRYDQDRNDPDREGGSGLSPYLHFGHIGAHEAFQAIVAAEKWSTAKLASKPNGKALGWWGMSATAEAFLDELITWREIGYNLCSQREDYDQFETLPEWAQKTLTKHARDKRPIVYSLEQMDRAETYDELWNAAQRQLIREGRIHNYMRMLWGKKVLEWSRTPREALANLIAMNNKYALDGRNPNSYSGIFWTLGRYDRAWGPERPIFGTVRYMSSESTARKLDVKNYLRRFAAQG